jgi:DNA-directed RNA polymerase specialized sigma subunit
MMTTAEKFAAAQVAFDGKIKTYARNALPHLSGHDRSHELDDICQELLTVLWKCVVAYDPDNGAAFNTFAQRSFQNRIASMVREVTAAKRTAVGGVVSISVESIGIAVDQAIQEWSAEDYAVAKISHQERSCVDSIRETGGGERGRGQTRARIA